MPLLPAFRRLALRACAACALVLPSLPHAATYTVSKDGRGAFSTIQAAVQKAGKGDIVEIIDDAVYPEQVTIDSNRHGLTLRSANPGALKKPTIRWRDTQNQGPRTCQEALSPAHMTFDQNGALRVLRARNVVIDGIGVDALSPAPFAWPGVWGNGVDCTSGNRFPLFHGNGGITLFLAGSVTVRRCDIANAFFGIAVKDRNEGGVFANFNPADLEKQNIVPLSGFGRTGNHLFEKNRIHHNTWGFYFESAWDLGSTARYNLIYENHHASAAAAAAVKALPDGEHHPGGGFLFKDVMITPLAVHNNTFWRNFQLFSGGYRPGAQHLVFNNIFSRPYEYYTGNAYGDTFHKLDPFFVNRMHHSVYAVHIDPLKYETQNVNAQLTDTALNRQVSVDSVVPLIRNARIMNGMGNPAQDSFVVQIPVPLSTGTVLVPRTLTGAILPGALIRGATAAEAFPASANVRWLETKFKSTDPASADFLQPDWDDPDVQKFVKNAGWPKAGIFNADGQVADLGAIPSTDRHADDIVIRPLAPVILNGTAATLTFDLTALAGTMTSPKVKLLRLVRGIPIDTNGFGGKPTMVLPPAVEIPAPSTTLNLGANTVTVSGFPALAPTENYAFFELVVEGTGTSGKPVTTNVGFLPWRKLDYKFLVEVLDAAGAKVASVKVGEPVRLRITPQRLDGTPFTNPVSPVEVSLNSGNDLLSGNPPVKLALTQVSGPTVSQVMFTKVPPGGSEYVTASGIWKNGVNTLAFYGVSDAIRILPGEPEKVLFQDPPSKIVSPGSAPVIDPGQPREVKVQVQDRFGNPSGAGVTVSIKSNHPLIGDIDGPASAATDSTGTATFRAKVTEGDLNEIFELEAAIAGKTPDRADLKVGQPRDRLWILYSDVAVYNPEVELRGAAGTRLPVTLRAGKTSDAKIATRSTELRIEASPGLAVYADPAAAAPIATVALAAGEVVVYVSGLRAVDNGSLTVSPVADNSLLPGTRAKIFFTFSPEAVQHASVHADNGFGRVDRLEVRFQSDLKRAPDSLGLSWPAPGTGTRILKDGIAWDAADPRKVTVRLADPYPAGLTTMTGNNLLGTAYVSLPSAPEIPPQAIAFAVADSVGPLIDSARVQERLQPSDDTLFVSLSEKAAGLAGASLILIKREGGAPVTLAVLSAQDLAQGLRFRVAVADLGALAPREGDSLRINPAGPLVDAYGNHAHASNRPVPLGLKTVPKPPVLKVAWDRPYAAGGTDADRADFVLYSVGADSSLTPVLAGDGRGALVPCPATRCGQPIPPGNGPGAPSFTILTDRPVKLSVTLFTNLGGYVNSLAGEVTSAQLGQDAQGLPTGTSLFRKDEQGRYAIRLAWNLRSHDRGSAGTGAYLAKVAVSGLAEDAEGKAYPVADGRTFRFGVLRR